MGKMMGFAKILECFSVCSSRSSSCFCGNSVDEEDIEKLPLMEIDSNGGRKKRLRVNDVVEKQTLAFPLKPKMVMLRVSMHCHGCARKVEKHISKMDGVSSYKVDLESKMVVVIGDIIPFEVLESVSKVKNAELWTSAKAEET
ncbi:protein SODIUM POTASSIUM ROOT DEFECTIVE 2 [Punica granatum]|uniref:Uncharacterized protein n=2 Tax=Punica granatum TaxID=22663 RepID=A0A2I0KDT0_PUNGR|nr:protein SODIUM POTASSIUM ROOT DEFECTIVE 2 [Punica granatum]PKI66681.1 hypothetical protein CRG98_012876 [Punica granatum]